MNWAGKMVSLAAIILISGCATTGKKGYDSGYFLTQAKSLVDLVQLLEIPDDDDTNDDTNIEYAWVEADDLLNHFTVYKPGDKELDEEILGHLEAVIHYLNEIELKDDRINSIIKHAIEIEQDIKKRFPPKEER
jgi:hypothetical protein